ncbi:capsular exopolysaccharide synthesis family protein [Natronocella acetinitrilica]|uniref:Capsular exopolysaccharide synthesis family protein n=1 Tax=Natronocella acetinitrilica TaxID=414046 RepID=A0AAE3G7I2_9GAMM|nr:CpsD/CapB family tyrosine-protein kinase [Natronocella acetinitrilica]MCP1675808.1 capsular exopolysaccharide synthesis family protein [Natronocella acetinitrilica]
MTDTIVRALDIARQDEDGDSPDMVARGGEQGGQKGPRRVQWNETVMERNRLITGAAPQQMIDCYSLLRTRVLHRVRQDGMSTLGITSPSPGDGKSLTSANLAISIAQIRTFPVLLVDSDVRRPSLARLFGLKVNAGLGDALVKDAAIGDVVLQLPPPGLFLIPGRTETRLRPEELSADRIQKFISSLKRMFPKAVVIFDLPPALVGGDVMVFAANLDATLLVVANHRTLETELQQATALLEGTNVIGTVLNFADRGASRKDYYGG